MDEYTVLAVVGEIRSVSIKAASQEAAEAVVLADPRVLIIIDKDEFDELGSTFEELEEDPKDPTPKVH